jgi:hypothetical protein
MVYTFDDGVTVEDSLLVVGITAIPPVDDVDAAGVHKVWEVNLACDGLSLLTGLTSPEESCTLLQGVSLGEFFVVTWLADRHDFGMIHIEGVVEGSEASEIGNVGWAGDLVSPIMVSSTM